MHSPKSPGWPPAAGWRRRLHEIIFEADTPAGRAFDVALLVVILLSVLAVLLESVPPVRQTYGGTLHVVEWTFTVLFTVEYVLRLISVTRPVHYAVSFFGMVDLLAVLPTYLALLVPSAQSLMVIRAVRLLRVFRILKLARFLEDAELLLRALRASRKITIFLGSLITIVLIVGTLMYLIEGEEHGFLRKRARPAAARATTPTPAIASTAAPRSDLAGSAHQPPISGRGPCAGPRPGTSTTGAGS